MSSLSQGRNRAWCLHLCVLGLVHLALGLPAPGGIGPGCKNLPGDAGWPARPEWDRLNGTVGGRLIATELAARTCHGSTYDAASCSRVQQQWPFAETYVASPAEIMTPLFQNQSCDPFTPRTQECVLGNHVSYSINVLSAADAQAGIEFAKKHNIRLVIKNTGHDWISKSTARGGLALWTHNLDSIEVLDEYTGSGYQGPAIKVGAGVMGGPAQAAASQRGYRLVAGSCPTVGLAGGFTQGGGHSILSGLYGLSADNILEWDVLTFQGERVKATKDTNKDLFWALGGGGGGTFGVVLSMTARLFPDGPVARASFGFGAAQMKGSMDAFWKAVDVFNAELDGIVRHEGIVLSYTIGRDSLTVITATAANSTEAEMLQVFGPLLDSLHRQFGLSREDMFLATTSSANYYEHYMSTLGAIFSVAPVSQVASSRLFGKRHMNAAARPAVTRAMRAATASGNFQLLCTALDVGTPATKPVGATAVFRAWREAVASCIIAAPWDWARPWTDLQGLQAELMGTITPALESATPGSGTYMNEGNFAQANWQREFYGENYERLGRIKQTYDPEGLIYGQTAVGSERWATSAGGRLCPVPAH